MRLPTEAEVIACKEPLPECMRPTCAQVARAHRHELQRQQQVRQQQQDAKESQHACAHHGALLSPQVRQQQQDVKESQQPVGVLWRTAPARLTPPTVGGYEFYFPEASPREHSTAHLTGHLTGSSPPRDAGQQPPPTGAFAPFRTQHALPHRTTPAGFVSGYVEPPNAIFGRTTASAASAAEAPHTAPTTAPAGYAASGVFTRPLEVFTRPLVGTRPASPMARGGLRAPKPAPKLAGPRGEGGRRGEGTRRAAPALQAARQLGAQNDASGPSGDPRGVSSNGYGSGSAVLSAALSSSSLGVGDAQDGASCPRAGLPSGGSPSPDASTVDASTATRVLRILLELTAPAGGGSLANFDVSTLRFDEAAKLIELAQAKLGVTSWAGNGRRAGGGVGAVVGAGRTLGSRGSLTPELLVQQVTELDPPDAPRACKCSPRRHCPPLPTGDRARADPPDAPSSGSGTAQGGAAGEPATTRRGRSGRRSRSGGRDTAARGGASQLGVGGGGR